MKGYDVRPGVLVDVTRLLTDHGIMASTLHLAGRQHGRGLVEFVSDHKAGDCIAWVRIGGLLAPYWNYELDLLGIPDP